jgi:histidinol-phosphatase (PHP family)
MKELINHHVHSTGSDGKLSPKEVVELAIEKKLDFICFTDHYPRHNKDPWSNNFFTLEYIEEIKKLKEYYKDKIEISFGVEIDWFENINDWIKDEIKKNDFDFVIGSVHILKINNKSFGLNFEKEIFKENAEKIGFKKLVKDYYNQIRIMVESKLFDCVGHLDVIKYYNDNSKYFNQEEKWYKEEIKQTLKLIKDNKLAIEINTSGLNAPCKEQYPSFWILKEANKLNIPLTIGSDMHYPGQINAWLEKAIELAKQAGYKSIIKFKNRKMIEIEI